MGILAKKNNPSQSKRGTGKQRLRYAGFCEKVSLADFLVIAAESVMSLTRQRLASLCPLFGPDRASGAWCLPNPRALILLNVGLSYPLLPPGALKRGRKGPPT